MAHLKGKNADILFHHTHGIRGGHMLWNSLEFIERYVYTFSQCRWKSSNEMTMKIRQAEDIEGVNHFSEERP